MSKWEVPTPAEQEIIRQYGRDPENCAVSHPGEDQLVILDWRDHSIADREIYVKLSCKN